MSLDTDSLQQPISLESPTGSDLRSESGPQSLYYRLKDARAQARLAERSAEAAEDPVVTVQPEWRTVHDLAIEALGRSKDLEVTAWLLESLVRLDGFAGLRDGLTLAADLVERFWPDLHSMDVDDAAGRIAPLAGLNGVGGEGALVQPLRMVPLIPGSTYGHNALWHVGRIARNPHDPGAREFDDAKAAAGLPAIREQARQAVAARDAFARLTTILDAACGKDAPPSSNIRNTFDEIVAAYRLLIGDAPEAIAPEPVVEPDAVQPQSPTGARSAGPRDIASREEAFAELLRIADFFRRSEPHSPISYALETLVTRGRMSFIDLLEELMPDAAQRKLVLQHAGIHANSDGRPT